MAKERNAFKAGVFIIISLILIIGIIVAIRGVGSFLDPMRRATASFKLTDDIGGLAPGDEVRMGGYKVGNVRKIEIVTGADNQCSVEVSFTLPQRFDVRKDAKVSVQGTLTGVSWLNFENLGTADALGENDKLVGRPSAMSVLFASVGELAPEIAATVKDVRNTTLPKVNSTVDTFKSTGESATNLFTQVRSKVDPVVDRYNGVADSAKNMFDQAGGLFGDTKSDFRTTVANLRDATGTVKEKLPPLMDRVDGLLVKITNAVEDTSVALQDVKKIAANTRDVSQNLRQILVTNRGKIETMITALKATGENLRNASAEVRRSPWRLLYQPKPGEMANPNLYDSARQFADGAQSMSDAAIALRDALKDPDVDQAQVQKLVEKLDSSFNNFDQVEKELWSQVKP